MREIKFRGRSIKDYETSLETIQKGDFVEGYYYYCRENDEHIIITTLLAESGGVGSGIVEGHIPIDIKTLGQYTGKKEKIGKKIYEGDLFHCIYYPEGHEDHIYQVCYSEAATKFYLKRIGNDCVQVAVIQTVGDVCRYDKIGNIYENPELLT